MRTITESVKAAYLGADLSPQSRITVRKNRLAFSTLVQNTQALGGYVDDEGKGRSVWGDSCVNGLYVARLINAAAWGGISHFLASITGEPDVAANWAYSDLDDGGVTVQDQCRVGLHPYDISGNEVRFYVWYAASNYVYRRELAYNTSTLAWSWGSTTVGAEIASPGATALALHPISETEAFVVGYQSPSLWVRYLKYNRGGWSSSGSARVVWMADTLAEENAQFSDAELLDASTAVLVLTLAEHGAVYALRYAVGQDTYSLPSLVLGGGPDDLGYRVFASGLTLQNNRLWAVTWRSVEGSDDHPYAHHAALASSADGQHWRDETELVGVHLCRGKLLVLSDRTYVAGNAMVLASDTPYKLGCDHEDLKREYLDTADHWRLSCPQAGSASSLGVHGLGDDLDLLDPEAQIVLEIGHDGTYDTLFTGTLAEPGRELAYGLDHYDLAARGALYYLAGDGAYQPPVARTYESAEGYYTGFTTERGAAHLSLRAESGVWTTTRDRGLGRYVLRGERGIALLPRTLVAQCLSLKTHLQPRTSLQGVFLVFWHEDEENYWRAGLYDDGGTVKLGIQHVVDGEVTTLASATVTATVGAWYSLYLDTRPGVVRAYFQDTDTNDFVPATASVSYTIAAGDPSVPTPYHVGLEVAEYEGVESASYSGTVTKAFKRQLQDDSKNWTSAVLNQYAYLPDDDQWRRVVEYRAVQDEGTGYYIALTVDTEWASIPAVGDDYGIYPEEGHPYAFFQDLALISFGEAWTADAIATDILERAGVSRTGVYSGQLNAVGSAEIHGDLDITISNVSSSDPQIVFHASVPDATRYHGWRLTIAASSITVERHYYSGGGVYESAYQVPSLASLSAVTGHTFRVVIRKNLLLVYADGHPHAAFAEMEGTGRGYCWYAASGPTYSLAEFPRLQDSFIWDAEQPNSALARLLQGFRAKLVERADGSVSLSRYDSRDELSGGWGATIIRRASRQGPTPTLLTLDGAEYRTHYLEPDGRPIRARRADNPAIESEEELVTEARRLARHAREMANTIQVALHVPDPRAEVEDQVEVNSGAWIVNSLDMTFSEGAYGMEAHLRQLLSEPGAGVWGTDDYGEFYYG